jgi:hypothetical protein
MQNTSLQMQGAMTLNGQLMRPGFLSANPGVVVGSVHLPGGGAMMPVSRAELCEALGRSEAQLKELEGASLERTEITGDMNQVLGQLSMNLAGLQRTLTASEVPVRENLEAPAVSLVPVETPLRNRLPRRPGSGTAVAWRQLSSLGGGWGVQTTVTTGAASATQTIGSTANVRPGDVLYFATTGDSRTVQSVTNGTTVVLSSTITTTTGETVTRTSIVQPGGGSAIRMFYPETGAPMEHEETYIPKSAPYKLLGAFGKITNFAVAAGRTYQDQLGRHRVNTLRNTMLNEEYALTRGDSTATDAPWGDGTNALAFDGLYNLVTTANGTPDGQVASAVGALTTGHLDAQLTRIWENGGRGLWMLLAAQEINSLANLAEASGSIIRVQATSANGVILGLKVSGYVHPVSGDIVDILPSRFASSGTAIFGADEGPEDASGDGDNSTMVVSVLPQLPLPEERPEGVQEVQGYAITELARELAAPDVIPHMVSVYEVLQMRNARVFAKSTGLAAV